MVNAIPACSECNLGDMLGVESTVDIALVVECSRDRRPTDALAPNVSAWLRLPLSINFFPFSSFATGLAHHLAGPRHQHPSHHHGRAKNCRKDYIRGRPHLAAYILGREPGIEPGRAHSSCELG